MKKTWWLVLLTVFTASTMWAQQHDSAPVNMQPEFANAQVRVLRLKIAPHGKVPMRAIALAPGPKDGQLEVWAGQGHQLTFLASVPAQLTRRRQTYLPA